MRKLILKLKSNSEIRDFLRMMSLMKKRRALYWLTLLLSSSVFAICLDIFMAYILRDITDAAVGNNMELLQKSVWLAAIMIVLSSVLVPSSIYTCIKCIQKTMTEVRLYLFEHLTELPMKYFDSNHSGTVVSRVINDMGMMQYMYFFPIFKLLMAVILGIGSIIVMFFLNWEISIALIILGAIAVLVNTVFSKPLGEISSSIQDSMGKMTGSLIDILSGSSVIKMLRINDKLAGIFQKKNTEISNKVLLFQKRKGLLDSINYVISILSFVGIIAFGIIQSIRDINNLGAAIACISLQGGVSHMFTSLGRFVGEIRGSLAGARRVFEIMDEPAEVAEGGPADDKACDFGGVTMKDLTFGYENQSILKNVSLQLEEGKLNIITGPSGCGKSTLLKLIAGLYVPDSGSIFINKCNIGDYSLDQLRELISYVPQDSFLFNCSIAENIRLGNLDASHDEIVRVAQIADAHDFIMEMPDGYDYITGENGSKLSGGQKQRIALARALLKKTSIVLLDEATSALDQEMEKNIIVKLKEELKGRTVIMVTHRLSSGIFADNIVQLNNLKEEIVLV